MFVLGQQIVDCCKEMGCELENDKSQQACKHCHMSMMVRLLLADNKPALVHILLDGMPFFLVDP